MPATGRAAGGASLNAPADDAARAAADTGSAARPGPPVTRLALDAQTRVQESAESRTDARKAGEDAPAGRPAGRENAAGEDAGDDGLTESERRRVEQLKQRDRQVREHERAHATAGGTIAGSPSFTFVTGPDGKQYAVGGEVSIDTSPVPGNPQATIRKMEQVKRAALAPANPSSQDRRVASQADAAILKAKQELAEQRREEQAAQAEGRAAGASDGTNGENRIGRSEPVFDPERRFRQSVGALGSPLGTGLAGGGELSTGVGLSDPGALLNMVA